MIFESLSNMFSNMDGLEKLLYILPFAIVFGIFAYRFGKNLGRMITLVNDIIRKIKSQGEE